MKIIKSKLPDSSLLNEEANTYDYLDSFEGSFKSFSNKVDATMLCKAFFSSGPKWIDKLFSLRNKIVKFFGLKTSGKVTNREEQLKNFKCEPGEQLGLFRVYHKTEKEVILGEDDKHLNFRVSLFLQANTDNTLSRTLVIISTVKFNNWFGRLYFLPVKPFHKRIVPAMLKGIIKTLEAEE